MQKLRMWVRGTLVILALSLVACSADPERAKQEYLASGDRYIQQKKYSEAIVQYRNALQQDPRFGDARLKLARAYRAARRWTQRNAGVAYGRPTRCPRASRPRSRLARISC